jgi:hypothetical protein
MTDQDTLLLVAGGLLALWWVVKSPEAVKGIGLVLLVGIIALGVAHAQNHAPRHHRRRHGHGHRRRHHRRHGR